MKILYKNTHPNENHNNPQNLLENNFLQLQSAIDSKEKMLLNKKTKINHMSKQNEFLENVKHDYAKYYKFIEMQKLEQINTLKRLHEYTITLTNLNNLHNENLENEKLEQDKILHEIDKIKKSLSTLIK